MASEKGYPHLVSDYGFNAIRNYKKTTNNEMKIAREEIDSDISIDEVKRTIDNLACVYKIEDTFKLSNSADLVVVGFLEGLIRNGDIVYVISGNNGKYTQCQIVGIEIGRQRVNQAANAFVALCIRNGGALGIQKGMVLFKRTSNY